jgi:hypothetical protein
MSWQEVIGRFAGINQAFFTALMLDIQLYQAVASWGENDSVLKL